MSVDTCLIRVTPLELKALSGHPESFAAFLEDLKQHANFYNPGLDDPVGRVLYVDEFTRSLLMDMTTLEAVFAPLNRALMLGSHVVDGGQYGHIPFHGADETKIVAQELDEFPEEDLRLRFQEHAAEFRISSAGYLAGDQAILAYQKAHFERLKRFYRAAAQQGEAMLLLVI